MAVNIFKELDKGNYSGLKRSISLYPNSVSLKNPATLTPLHIAAQQGQAAFVKELLVHGALADTTDNRGNIPLHLAAEQGNVETVAELLAGRKATVKTKNKDGQTPLHVAVLGGHKEVVSKLLETGIQAELLKDKAGNTPLSLVDPNDTEMQQVFANARPLGTAASINQGLGTPLGTRGPETGPGAQRGSPGPGATTPIAGNSGRISMAPSPSFAGAVAAGAQTGATTTPPRRGAAAGTPAGGRTPPSGVAHTPGMAAGGRTPPPAPSLPPGGGMISRVARNSASPGQSRGGAAPEQLMKQELLIQSLRDGLRAATERIGALDGCAAAQLECAGHVEKALEACGNHGRALLDLDARVAFQEDRGRDTRGRLERLEEGERDRQGSVKRLMEDQRSLHSQMQRLADQVAANSSTQRHSSVGDAASSLMHGQQHLHSEVAVLRAQLDQLSPSLALATAASAEVRTLAARLDVMQQQMQQQPLAHPHVGGSVVMEQQVLQLQAQVQLLQLPVANLTQQCAELSSRMAGFTDWQQHANTELARLADDRQAQQSVGSRAGIELSDAVMQVLDATARSVSDMRQQQDETAKQVSALLQQQQQQQAAVPASPPPPSGPPTLPGTPQSASQRVSGAGDFAMAPLGGPPSRNGHPNLNSMMRDAAAQVEMRGELESLKSLMSDIRKEVATEGGSIRREWQRAFSDMQSRYGEQNNELRAREANIAKLREAALVEEAERRATNGFEDKFTARMGKLETNVEYLTHRLEVLEEQVSGVVSTLTGAASPVVPLSPTRMAAAFAAMRGQPRSGPGPVSENHNGFVLAAPDLTAAAATPPALASARVPPSPKQGRCWSAGGPMPVLTAAAAAVQSDGGCLRRRVPLFGAGSARDTGYSGAGGEGMATGGAASARGGCSARDASDRGLGPEEWWRAADAEPPGPLEVAAAPAAAAAGKLQRSAQGFGGATPPPFLGVGKVESTATEAEAAGQGAVSAPQPDAATAPGVAAAGQLPGLAHAAAAVVKCSPAPASQLQPPLVHPRPAAHSLAAQDGTSPWPEPAVAASSQRGPPPSAREHALSAHAVQPDVGAGLLDSANVALGSQLLTPMAHAMLPSSVDIQRLAAAAAAQQQQHYAHPQQQQPFSAAQQQQQAPALLPWGGQQLQQRPTAGQEAGSPDFRVGGRNAGSAGGTVGPGQPAAAPEGAAGSGSAPGRKEPPLCLFCPMQ